jgi:hypothetical protein
MSKKIIAIVILLVITGGVFTTGCYKVTTLVIPDTGQEVTTTVSLTNDIIPILNKSCNVSGCHSSGGQNPDLTAGKVYNSLVNGNYFNLANPDQSEIYLWLTGKRPVTMPEGAANNPSNINQLVLAWVKQGAKNN